MAVNETAHFRSEAQSGETGGGRDSGSYERAGADPYSTGCSPGTNAGRLPDSACKPNQCGDPQRQSDPRAKDRSVVRTPSQYSYLRRVGSNERMGNVSQSSRSRPVGPSKSIRID